jgi:hypothetical protein
MKRIIPLNSQHTVDSLKVPFEEPHLSAVLDMVMLQRVVVYGEYFGTQDFNGAKVKLRGVI